MKDSTSSTGIYRASTLIGYVEAGRDLLVSQTTLRAARVHLAKKQHAELLADDGTRKSALLHECAVLRHPLVQISQSLVDEDLKELEQSRLDLLGCNSPMYGLEGGVGRKFYELVVLGDAVESNGEGVEHLHLFFGLLVVLVPSHALQQDLV